MKYLEPCKHVIKCHAYDHVQMDSRIIVHHLLQWSKYATRWSSAAPETHIIDVFPIRAGTFAEVATPTGRVTVESYNIDIASHVREVFRPGVSAL